MFYFYIQTGYNMCISTLQVAHLPELRRLNKELLLEIIKAKADDEGETTLSKDWSLSNISDI